MPSSQASEIWITQDELASKVRMSKRQIIRLKQAAGKNGLFHIKTNSKSESGRIYFKLTYSLQKWIERNRVREDQAGRRGTKQHARECATQLSPVELALVAMEFAKLDLLALREPLSQEQSVRLRALLVELQRAFFPPTITASPQG
jgi:hypothetical protein